MQYSIGSLQDIMQLKKTENKTEPKKSNKPKISIAKIYIKYCINIKYVVPNFMHIICNTCLLCVEAPIT